MKKRRLNPFTPVVLILIIALVSMAGISAMLSMRSYRNAADDLETFSLDAQHALNAKGGQGLPDDPDFKRDVERLPQAAKANVVLLDMDGRILYASGTDYLQGQDRLNLLISPYQTVRPNWTTRDTYTWSADMRLALLVDDAGEILLGLGALHTPDEILPGTNPIYRRYFPALNDEYYRDLQRFIEYNMDGYEESKYDWESAQPPTSPNVEGAAQGGDATESPAYSALPDATPWPDSFIDDGDFDDDWDDWGDSAPLLPPPDGIAAQKVREYVQWENQQFDKAGNLRLIARGPSWDGCQLLVFYQAGDDLYLGNQQQIQNYDFVSAISVVALGCVMLLIIALAGWVFIDARRRGFRPALWGVLTLIGNVVALIIYMMVRPEARRARVCPGCGIVLKQAYAFCPGCGQPLLSKCAGCGRALDEAFRFCPDCGAAVSPPATPENPSI